VTYRVRLHPAVARDLDAIVLWSLERAGPPAAERRLTEIEAVLSGLAGVPQRGSRRDEIAPGLRAIPAGRKAVVAFVVDDDQREVRVLAVTYAGADWAGRARARG
jgi:plasmid stabilization system protein ParE